MSHEAKLPREQASTRVEILEQPERAEEGARRRYGAGKHEPAVLPYRRHRVEAQTDWIGSPIDEPLAHLGQVGGSRRLGRDTSHHQLPITMHEADSKRRESSRSGRVHTKKAPFNWSHRPIAKRELPLEPETKKAPSQSVE